MNKKAKMSPITQTQLIWGLFRLAAVLILYFALLNKYIQSIQNENIKMVIMIIIFIIGLAFVIGSGRGIMEIGKIFKFKRHR